jgi:glycosyltransferase involved in cell wall biosynthesis
MNVDISICVISYNHEDFILRALESINFQKFNGNVELIIGVDLSTDKTVELVEEFIQIANFPVHLIKNTERRGMFLNLYDVFKLAKGKYIAILEGDDYWVLESKLQMQFDFMQENDNCVATGGNINILTNKIISNKKWNNRKNQFYNLTDFVHANRMSFCTVMFKRECLDFSKFELLKDSPHLDWPIYIILLKSKPNAYIKVYSKVLSNYRVHSNGVYSGVSLDVRQKNVVKTMSHIKAFLTEPELINYIEFSIKSQENKTVYSLTENIQKNGINFSSLPSFYLHNYGKKQMILSLIKNFWLTPKFTYEIIKKYKKRYKKD